MMPQVKVYSTTTCAYCHMLKQYLDSRDVAYKDIVVDLQPGEVQNLIDTCGSMGVPCTHITKADGTEERILGFDKARINTALGLT